MLNLSDLASQWYPEATHMLQHPLSFCFSSASSQETRVLRSTIEQSSFLPSKAYLFASVRDHHHSGLKLVSTLRCKTSAVLTYPRSCSWGKPEEWKASVTGSDWLPELHSFVGLRCQCTVCPPLSGINTSLLPPFGTLVVWCKRQDKKDLDSVPSCKSETYSKVPSILNLLPELWTISAPWYQSGQLHLHHRCSPHYALKIRAISFGATTGPTLQVAGCKTVWRTREPCGPPWSKQKPDQAILWLWNDSRWSQIWDSWTYLHLYNDCLTKVNLGRYNRSHILHRYVCMSDCKEINNHRRFVLKS